MTRGWVLWVFPLITAKPNNPAMTNPSNIHIRSNPNCAHPDEEDDNASLMMEYDSSFGDIDRSFDMDALEESMKMYD